MDVATASANELPPGDYVCLSVTDTGTGMTADVARRVFEPFFTTKPLGQGTGLGLSMVYGFVRQSGGQVLAESRPGAGTTMTLYLPRYHGAFTPEDVAPSRANAAQEHRGSVLLIEDEEDLRQILAEVLAWA